MLAALTASEAALRAARRWVLALLAEVEDRGAPARPGLLDGAAGVVLVLLAAATDDVPCWNRLLLSA